MHLRDTCKPKPNLDFNWFDFLQLVWVFMTVVEWQVVLKINCFCISGHRIQIYSTWKDNPGLRCEDCSSEGPYWLTACTSRQLNQPHLNCCVNCLFLSTSWWTWWAGWWIINISHRWNHLDMVSLILKWRWKEKITWYQKKFRPVCLYWENILLEYLEINRTK